MVAAAGHVSESAICLSRATMEGSVYMYASLLLLTAWLLSKWYSEPVCSTCVIYDIVTNIQRWFAYSSDIYPLQAVRLSRCYPIWVLSGSLAIPTMCCKKDTLRCDGCNTAL